MGNYVIYIKADRHIFIVNKSYYFYINGKNKMPNQSFILCPSLLRFRSNLDPPMSSRDGPSRPGSPQYRRSGAGCRGRAPRAGFGTNAYYLLLPRRRTKISLVFEESMAFNMFPI